MSPSSSPRQAPVVAGALLALLAFFAAAARAQTDQEVARTIGLRVDQVEAVRNLRGMSNSRLLSVPPQVVPKLVRRLQYPDLPLRRLHYLAEQYGTDPANAPIDGRARAARQLRELQRAAAPTRSAGIPVFQPRPGEVPREAGLEQAKWNWHGPGNIGGRTRAIVIHPTEPKKIWVGSVGGGIWTSTDGGETWERGDDFMGNLVVSCMAMDPMNPDVMYAGTGERVDGEESLALPGDGVFKTSDGGKSWQALEATRTDDFRFVNRFAVSSGGEALLAATFAGIFRSRDGGASWEQVHQGTIMDVDFHPRDPLQAIAGGLFDGASYYTTDGGSTWTAAALPDTWRGRAEVTYAAADPSIVYASIEHRPKDSWNLKSNLCRSSDGGKSFTLLSGENNYLGAQGMYDNVIWAGDPTDSNFVIVGGIDLHAWKGTDLGRELVPISTWWDRNSAHADQHVIIAHPQYDGVSNRTVYFGNDGGVYKTDDVREVGGPREPRTRGWISLNRGFGVTQLYGAAANPASGAIIAGSQDNGTLLFTPDTGENAWRTIEGGDGGWCAADPGDPQFLYGEVYYLQVFRSSDGGRSIQYIDGRRNYNESPVGGREGATSWKTPPYQIGDARQGLANFISPMVLDPNEPNRLYAGGLSLWRSDSVKAELTFSEGPAWRSIKPPLIDEEEKHPISVISVDPNHPEHVWVGHNNGALFSSHDATAEKPQWRRIDSQAAGMPARWSYAVTIDPHDTQTVYVGFIGFTKGNLWKTADGGQTWTDLSQKLPEASVRSIAVHPDIPGYVYIATDVGVFASENGGAAWSPTNNDGPANVAVYQLTWSDRTLLAVTYGRGIFSIDLKSPGPAAKRQ